MGKIKSILKIAGISYILCGGVLTAGVIGGTMLGVGIKKENDAPEVYRQSEEFQAIQEEEDAKIENLKNIYEDAKVQYANKEISYIDFVTSKEGYESEVRYSENKLFEESFKETQNAEIKAMLKTGKNLQYASIPFIVIGGLYFIIKTGISIVLAGDEGPFAVGKACIEAIKDEIDEMENINYTQRAQINAEKRRKKEEKKKLKQAKKMKDTHVLVEPEEKLTDVEDQYYNY